MSPGTITAIIVVAIATLSGIGYVVVGKWLARPRVPWRRLEHPPTGFEAVRYFGVDHQVDEQLLVRALLEAVRLLAEHTVWSSGAIMYALRDVRFYVEARPTWVNRGGSVVAGEIDGKTVFLGRPLHALLHECAHVCEETLDVRRNLGHVGWDGMGIRDAETSFHGWLLAQSPPQGAPTS